MRAVVEHDHVFEQVGGLVDEVGREHEGSRVLGVVGQQPVVEQMAGDGVEARVRLVEQRHLWPGGQPDDDAEGGAHARGRAS